MLQCLTWTSVLQFSDVTVLLRSANGWFWNCAQVQQALSGLPDRTLLVIAHKLSTIEKADQIVVISGGVVEDRGSHQDLMEKKGSYYKLVEKLFAE